jgi:hypothetical protein
MKDEEEGLTSGKPKNASKEEIAKQSANVWQYMTTNPNFFGFLFTLAVLCVELYTFQWCRVCVIVILIMSTMLCLRVPYMIWVFWPSLLIVLFNSHVLRKMQVKTEFPIGEMMDNAVWGPG